MIDYADKSWLRDDEAEALRKRNEQRAKELIEQLGERYLCHPANRVQRITPQRPEVPQWEA